MHVGQGFAQGERAFARRVDQPFVERAELQQGLGIHLEQIASLEPGALRQAVEHRVVTRALHQRLAAFHTQHRCGAGGQRQGEVAEAAKPVGNAFAGRRRQQPQRARNQRPVDAVVHLGEVGGPEGHAHAELGQGVCQPGGLQIQRRCGVRAAWLQPPLHAVLRREPGQSLPVGGTKFLQVAQHQHGLRVAFGQFDLRQAVRARQAGDELAQGQEQGRHMRRQDGAGLHVGHIAGAALVKPDQDSALLVHQAHGEACAVAIAPVRASQGTQQRLRPHLGNVPEVVLQGALLEGELGLRVDVLHAAAAADAEMRATRLDARVGRALPFHSVALLPLGLAAGDAHAHHLAGQGARGKHHFAIGAVGNAPGLEVKRLDGQPFVGDRCGFHGKPGLCTARNAMACGGGSFRNLADRAGAMPAGIRPSAARSVPSRPGCCAPARLHPGALPG